MGTVRGGRGSSILRRDYPNGPLQLHVVLLKSSLRDSFFVFWYAAAPKVPANFVSPSHLRIFASSHTSSSSNITQCFATKN